MGYAMKYDLICSILAAFALFLVTKEVKAQTCTNDFGACLTVENDSTSTPGVSAIMAQLGHCTNGNTAIYGFSGCGNSSGVYGESLLGAGVSGQSDTGNGVLGVTTTGPGAAVSAGSPSASGLAYWGTGGLNITGSLQIGSQNDTNARTGNGSAWKPGGNMWSSNSSDLRTKKDIRDFRQGLAEVLRVRPVTYKYNGLGGTQDDGMEYVGVIAQELEKVAPTMVLTRKALLHNSDANPTDIKTVDPSAFTYMLINAIQEQQRLIEGQDARIQALERTHRPLMSPLTAGVGLVTVGLVPLGLIAARRRRD
jgi:hypothetical protein